MNYTAMARAIRAERRGIWEGLGKPSVLAWRCKPRQCGAEGYISHRMMMQALGFEHVPFRDLETEDMVRDAINSQLSESDRIKFLQFKWRSWAAGMTIPTP